MKPGTALLCLLATVSATSLVRADATRFQLNEETRRLWNPAPQVPDWGRAEHGLAVEEQLLREVLDEFRP